MVVAGTSGRRRVVRTIAQPPSFAANGAVPVPRREHRDLAATCELLTAANQVVLLAHIGPDADALGSALALGLGLASRGTDVTVAFAEPAQIPQSLQGLPGQHLICAAADVPVHPDLVVSLDVNSKERLGSLASLFETASASLVIDHHASNTRFGLHHLVDANAESTTVLVAAILDELGITIGADIAANIYAGLATDTVGFRFASGDAHRLAARLLNAGVDPDELMRPITDLHPFGWLGMLSSVLGAAVLDRSAADGRGLVSTVITATAASGLRSEELDSVIDILRTASEAAVAAVLKETGDQQWQVSLRSRPGIDVACIATGLGGGGHVRAAGFGFCGTPDEALAMLTRALARKGAVVREGPGSVVQA